MRATSCIILHVHISLIHYYHCANLKKLFYNFSFEFFPTTYELPVGIFDFKCPFNKKKTSFRSDRFWYQNTQRLLILSLNTTYLWRNSRRILELFGSWSPLPGRRGGASSCSGDWRTSPTGKRFPTLLYVRNNRGCLTFFGNCFYMMSNNKLWLTFVGRVSASERS